MAFEVTNVADRLFVLRCCAQEVSGLADKEVDLSAQPTAMQSGIAASSPFGTYLPLSGLLGCRLFWHQVVIEYLQHPAAKKLATLPLWLEFVRRTA